MASIHRCKVSLNDPEVLFLDALMWLRLQERLVRYLDFRVEHAMRDIAAMWQDIPMV